MGQITEEIDKLQDIVGTDYRTNGQIAGYTWDRLQNKWTNCRIHLGEITKQMDKLQDALGTDYKTNGKICKGTKNNTNFGQITGIQEKLDTSVHF